MVQGKRVTYYDLDRQYPRFKWWREFLINNHYLMVEEEGFRVMKDLPAYPDLRKMALEYFTHEMDHFLSYVRGRLHAMRDERRQHSPRLNSSIGKFETAEEMLREEKGFLIFRMTILPPFQQMARGVVSREGARVFRFRVNNAIFYIRKIVEAAETYEGGEHWEDVLDRAVPLIEEVLDDLREALEEWEESFHGAKQ